VRLLHVTIERLNVERELPQIGGLDLLRLQLERDETGETTVEEAVQARIAAVRAFCVFRSTRSVVPAGPDRSFRQDPIT